MSSEISDSPDLTSLDVKSNVSDLSSVVSDNVSNIVKMV